MVCLKPRPRLEDEIPFDEDESHEMKWWNQGGASEEDGGGVAISQVDLREHVDEIWEKIGGRRLERWVAEIREDGYER